MDKSVRDRFFKKVSKRPDKNGCLVWLGHLSKSGNGSFSSFGINTTAHRIAWMLEHGPIPTGALIFHRCGNPSCVNHLHLFLGSQKDRRSTAAHVRERFLKKVSSEPDENGCLIWLGYCTKGGYGTFSVSKGRCTTAHRVAWEFENGPIPDGLWVLHRCDTPPCVRVDHLFLGTPQENMLDAKSKGRLSAGKDHWAQKHPGKVIRGTRHYLVAHPEQIRHGSQLGRASKLTNKAVMDIRKSWRSTGTTKLSHKYGVDKVTIHSVLAGKTWTHLPAGDYDPIVAASLSSKRLTKRRLASYKLTPSKVRTIRRLFRQGGFAKIALAKKFGVTDGTIRWVVSRKTWAHLPNGD